MDTLEQTMFKNQTDKIRKTVSRGNLEMQELIQNATKHNSSVQTPITESLSSLEVRHGDYVYLPGGHWRPATCQPRWKVQYAMITVQQIYFPLHPHATNAEENYSGPFERFIRKRKSVQVRHI